MGNKLGVETFSWPRWTENPIYGNPWMQNNRVGHVIQDCLGFSVEIHDFVKFVFVKH